MWRRWRRSESWLASPNTFLNARPIEKLQTVTGLIEVIAHLDARRALV
ncbi:MbcA/ParS/Xre antitoxin family protein [Bosea sp. OK403]|nr:MbcA/ParS/Xre antitoxin family protein [Bosea sp. OK403]